MLKYLVDKFKTHQSKIDEWFRDAENRVAGDPVYASVDLRNAGYKIAPVDTNIFPAGFNNLCPSYRREAGKLFQEFLQKYYPEVRRIAILAEEHTRNLFYFENLFQLASLLRALGIEVEVASLSSKFHRIESPRIGISEGNGFPSRGDQREGGRIPSAASGELVGETVGFPQKNAFETAEKNYITIWKAKISGYLLRIPPFSPDLILVNNDFSAGIPPALKKIAQPIIPTPRIGWRRRKKSDHFLYYEKLAASFSRLIGMDPWIISAPFWCMGEIDFSDPKSMTRLATKVDILLSQTRAKFKEYNLQKTPYIFVKNDAGTYGMAVMTATSGDELIHLNKKDRTRMKMGKGRRLVTEVIIQEGIPTIDRFKGLVAEPVIYLVNNKVCGGFFRLNETGDALGNLNQPGMKFTKLCFHEMMGYSNEYEGKCNLECLAMIYKNIARIASLAAGFEIKKAMHTS